MKEETVAVINSELLDQTSHRASGNERKRINHNFHQPPDVVQRFLNAIEPESYIRPHRHLNPPRDEVFIVLRGKGAIVLFDEEGTVVNVVALDPSIEAWGADIKGGVFHTIVSLEAGSVFYEIKPGPYDPDADKGFAAWAPEEGSSDVNNYLHRLKQTIRQFLELGKS